MKVPLQLVLVLASVLLLPSARANAVITNGVMYEWNLEEATGPSVHESISGRNMEAFGSPGLNAVGITGAAYSFDGVNDYLAAPVQSESFGQTDFTLSAWVRTTSPQTKVATILFHQSTAGWFELALSYDGTPYFFAQDYQTHAYVSLSGNGPLNDGEWHMLSVVREGDSVRLYAGTRLVVSQVSPLMDVVSGTGQITIGGANNDDFYRGIIDDVAIYSRALSETEILSNAIPEPSTSLLMVGAAGVFSGRRNYRRRT